MSFFVTFRQLRTASKRFLRPYEAMVPDVMDTSDTNDTELSAADPAYEPHIGRPMKGCTVGMEAFASPICNGEPESARVHPRRARTQSESRRTCAQAMTPDLMTISGFAAKFSGFHNTRSASVPTATCPMRWDMPCVMALQSR